MGMLFFGKIGIACKGMNFLANMPVRLVGLIGAAILVGTVMGMSDRDSGAAPRAMTFDELAQQAERQKEFCRTIAGLANPTYEQLLESVRRGCPD